MARNPSIDWRTVATIIESAHVIAVQRNAGRPVSARQIKAVIDESNFQLSLPRIRHYLKTGEEYLPSKNRATD
jgi:hypothetical protein